MNARQQKSAPILPAAQATHYAMGTVMAYRVFGLHAEESLSAARQEITRIEGLLSRFLPSSDINRLNRAAGGPPVRIHRDTAAVLLQAAAFSQACPGCFDVTIVPLVNVWQQARQTGSQPEESAIRRALTLVNHEDVILKKEKHFPLAYSARLAHPGQGVDLGGIGKGYAGECVRHVFQQSGIKSAYANLGGNVVTLGTKPDGAAWQIGIQHPRDENQILGVVQAADRCVVTSGDYQRYYTDQQGRRHHHILDPLTGYPAESGLTSVSIVAENALAADALSTAVFVAGLEKGQEILRRFPQVEAILVDRALQVYLTNGLRYHFQPDRSIGVTILD